MGERGRGGGGCVVSMDPRGLERGRLLGVDPNPLGGTECQAGGGGSRPPFGGGALCVLPEGFLAGMFSGGWGGVRPRRNRQTVLKRPGMGPRARTYPERRSMGDGGSVGESGKRDPHGDPVLLAAEEGTGSCKKPPSRFTGGKVPSTTTASSSFIAIPPPLRLHPPPEHGHPRPPRGRGSRRPGTAPTPSRASPTPGSPRTPPGRLRPSRPPEPTDAYPRGQGVVKRGCGE